LPVPNQCCDVLREFFYGPLFHADALVLDWECPELCGNASVEAEVGECLEVYPAHCCIEI